jgi:hypothetical protein
MLMKNVQHLFRDRLLKDIWETINPPGSAGVFVILRGFIDESYDQKIFVLSALVAVGTEWRWLSRDWLACIDKRNKLLISQGRNPITRFHAAECNSQDYEYEGWSREEQIEFMAELTKVLGKSALYILSLALDMEAFHKVFPDTQSMAQSDFLGSIYGMMTGIMAHRLAPPFVTANPTVRITLVHDRCTYDGVIADAFRQALEDPDFKESRCYTSITPASSVDVPPLQMADLLAHESFKEIKRRYKSSKKDLAKRRTSFKVLIKQGNIGGGLEYIQLEALRAIAQALAENKSKFSRARSAESPLA